MKVIYKLLGYKRGIIPIESKLKFAVGVDEESCLVQIKDKLGSKWSGFEIVKRL